MSSELTLEAYRQFRLLHDRYVYFLLAAAGAGIGLSVNQTGVDALSWSHVPLGGAVLSWGLSFSCGCCYLARMGSTLYATLQLLIVAAGKHSDAHMDVKRMTCVATSLERTLSKNAKRLPSLIRSQFQFLVLGAVLYIVWHVLRMWLRTLE